MKAVLILSAVMLMSFSSYASKTIVNAHLSKGSVVVQLQDSKTGSTKWISTSTVGIINGTLGCDGTNCFATHLKNQAGSLYGDVALQGDAKPSLENVFLISFYEDTLIESSHLQLLEVNGGYVIAIPVK